MKKKIFLIFILLISYQILFSNSIIIFDLFSLEIPDEITFYKVAEKIYPPNDLDKNYMVRVIYNCDKGKDYFQLNIYLRPKKDIAIESIKEFTKIKEISQGSSSFGMGEIYSLMSRDSQNVLNINIDNLNIKKYILGGGSEIIREVIQYYFDIKNNSIFDGCLIETYDIWPRSDEILPKDLSAKFIEAEIKKNNKKIELYKVIDDIIKSIKFSN